MHFIPIFSRVHFQVNMTRNMITQPVNSSVMTYSSDKFDKMMVITSSLIKSNASLLSYGLKYSGQERETDELVNREELGCVKEVKMEEIGKEKKRNRYVILVGVKEMLIICQTIQLTYTPREHDINIILRSNEMLPTFDREKTSHVKIQAIFSEDLLSVDKQLEKSFSKWKMIQQEAQYPELQALRQWETIGNYKTNCAHIEQQHCKRDDSLIFRKQNYEHKRHTEDRRAYSKEIKGKTVSTILKNQVEPKLLPNFESFTIEEEEGSGGNGTVYRAQRKHDGLTLAIKFHIQNELKLLERFGGKNFVIKYEGSFKYGSADCLVLEHVEHDRPEVFKREIDVFQLQWYGYCLFIALGDLHKLDLHHKYVISDKSAMSYDMGFNHVPLPPATCLPPAKSRTFLTTKAWETVNQEAGKGSKSLPLPKNLKKKTNQKKEHADLSSRNIIKSQGADGSGITSTKDAASTRIPSPERMREPVPCQGRKELISLAHEAMQGPNHEVTSIPASKIERIAAPHERLDRKLVYLTPMPLHSSGIAVAGDGLIKSKGDGKHKKGGPCVGSKGFRAPEVLFRSPYQGPKIDIWSAGVTLLYLLTGRSPFVGGPDQNIKDSAKLRGSEELWEVAKLHSCESSFPAVLLIIFLSLLLKKTILVQELYDMQSLPSKKLRDWCGLYTKRLGFLEVVSRSFYDLVDKCLTVNPRLRISAEEALRHEFFAPYHKQLRKQRLLAQARAQLELWN